MSYLDSIANVEGANKYGANQGYDITFNGHRFDSYDSHPNIRFDLANGDYTTAAGAFQITKGTYDWIAPLVGVTDFSPDSQRAIASGLAAVKKDKNGVSALEHIVNGNYETATGLLKSTWAALPQQGNTRVSSQAFYNDLNNNLARYTDGDFTPITPRDRSYDAQTQGDPATNFTLPPVMSPDSIRAKIQTAMGTPRLAISQDPITNQSVQNMQAALNGQVPAAEVPFPTPRFQDPNNVALVSNPYSNSMVGRSPADINVPQMYIPPAQAAQAVPQGFGIDELGQRQANVAGNSYMDAQGVVHSFADNMLGDQFHYTWGPAGSPDSAQSIAPVAAPQEGNLVTESAAVSAERMRQRLADLRSQLERVADGDVENLFGGSNYPRVLDSVILRALDTIYIPPETYR